MPLGLPNAHPLLTQHFDSPAVAFSRIDKEILALQETIRALRAFRNTFTPVYRLPNELLTRVFSFVQHIHSNNNELFFDRKKTLLRWTVVVRVSQHWRNVALSSPSLWSHISSVYPKRIFQEWTLRSKTAPLSIDSNHVVTSVDDLIGTSLFRIREMTLTLHWSGWRALEPKLFSAAPILESFSLNLPCSDTTQTPTGISHRTFAGTTPNLRRLELCGGFVDITAPLFRDLTSLSIRQPRQKLSAPDLLTAISNCPRLTTLNLFEVLSADATSVSDKAVINLPSLETLVLKGESILQDLAILSYLTFPATTSLEFTTRTGIIGLTTLTNFLRVYERCCQPVSTPPPSHPLRFTLQSEWNSLKMALGAEATRQRNPIPHTLQFEVTGTFRDDFELPDTPEIISLFLALPLSNVVSLALGSNCGMSVGAWVTIFGCLPKLGKIETSGEGGIRVLEAIVDDYKKKPVMEDGQSSQQKTGKRGRGGRGGAASRRGGKRGGKSGGSTASSASTVTWEPIFPKLEAFTIHDSVFPDSMRVDDLVSALRARKQLDKTLKTLDITECRNAEPFVDALYDVVGDVQWDGWRGSEDDEKSEEEDDMGSYRRGYLDFEEEGIEDRELDDDDILGEMW